MLKRRVTTLVALAFLSGALTTATTASSAAPRQQGAAVAGAVGIGDPYFPEDGNGGYDVARYVVRVGYDFGSRRLTGRTTVVLRTTEALRSFDLDLLLPVSRVSLSTGPATFTKPDRHELRITPRHPIPAGTRLRATVTYAGHPGSLSWDGESNWVADAHEVAVINEPHMAPWWFPSNDHPLDKAAMDLHVTVPRGYQVVAGGRLAGVRQSATRTTYHWQAGPMATYLAFFVAGHLQVRSGTADGLPYYDAVSRELSPAERRTAMTALARTPGIVSWIAAHVGGYPFAQTGGVVTALDPGFSLETQTRPTYPTFDGSVPRLLLVHELSHQWFGDSVSVHHWRDIWLNEGFATFMEHWWTSAHHGPSTRRWLHQAYAAEPTGSSFWDLTISDPGPTRLFDYPVYQRGGMTLAALRDRIGAATFTRLLRTWTRVHRHGHATTGAFERLAAQLSGQDLTSFFDAWLRQAGKPAATADNGL